MLDTQPYIVYIANIVPAPSLRRLLADHQSAFQQPATMSASESACMDNMHQHQR